MNQLFKIALHAAFFIMVTAALQAQTKYARYENSGVISFGVVEGNTVHELEGSLFDSPKRNGRSLPLSDAQLLTPYEPSKVLAVGLNYKSHLGDRDPAPYPGLFSKFPSTLTAHDTPIQMPVDATNLHYEGELVIVMGKKASKVSSEEASDYIFGVTIGNDVSERDWQAADLQWIRSKASDSFGPVGPYIVTGLDHNNLLLETRLNGKTVQSENTSDLIFNVEEIVSYISNYVTLLPGDLIYTGTPDATQAMKEGDVIEVEIEGIGILRNVVKRVN